MNFMDTVKKSLGFEIDEEPRQQYRNNNPNRSSPNRPGPRQNPSYGAASRPRPDFDDIEPIIPEQPLPYVQW